MDWGEGVCQKMDAMKQKQRCTAGTRYTLLAANMSRGAGSDDIVEPEHLMKESLRVLMGPDDPTGKKGKRHIKRSVKLVVDLGDLEFHAKSDIPSMWEELAGDFPQMQVLP